VQKSVYPLMRPFFFSPAPVDAAAFPGARRAAPEATPRVRADRLPDTAATAISRTAAET